MRLLFITIICLGAQCLIAQSAGNYILIVNNDTIHINLNTPVNFTSESGEDISVELTQPDILTYDDEMISFDYSKSLNISNTEIETGVEQVLAMKSTGNGFMVQKFSDFNPSGLAQVMLNELIKESVSYGYSKKEKRYKKRLASGEQIEGVEATLTYKGEKEVYRVATYGAKDEGIIVITMLLSDESPEDRGLIELFLNSLEIKF